MVDGEVTTEDVKFSYERFIDPELKASYADDWAQLDHVEIIDKYNGQIVLNGPFAPIWHSTLPVTAGWVLCKKYAEEVGLEGLATKPLGSGPYILAEWLPKQQVTLKRNPDYFGPQPYYDEIDFIPIEDDKAAEIAMEAGELDFSQVSIEGRPRLFFLSRELSSVPAKKVSLPLLTAHMLRDRSPCKELDSLGADFYGGNLHKWLCAPKGSGFLYARSEMQSLLKPLVVSWGYESITPSGSNFIDHNDWWGTRDHAAFLTVPAAIRFQKENDWDSVRESCHQLVAYAQKRICELTELAPLHPSTGDWCAQMAAAPLPADTNNLLLKNRLYDEYRIEVPLIEWNGNKLIRISVQGYNTKRDINKLLSALTTLIR